MIMRNKSHVSGVGDEYRSGATVARLARMDDKVFGDGPHGYSLMKGRENERGRMSSCSNSYFSIKENWLSTFTLWCVSDIFHQEHSGIVPGNFKHSEGHVFSGCSSGGEGGGVEMISVLKSDSAGGYRKVNIPKTTILCALKGDCVMICEYDISIKLFEIKISWPSNSSNDTTCMCSYSQIQHNRAYNPLHLPLSNSLGFLFEILPCFSETRFSS